MKVNRLTQRIIIGGYIAGIVFIWGRLFLIQVVLKDKYRVTWRKRHEKVVKVIPYRGEIISDDGVILAISTAVPSLYADPEFYRDNYNDNSPEILAKLLRIKNIREKLGDLDSNFVWLRRFLTKSEVKKVEWLKKKLLRWKYYQWRKAREEGKKTTLVKYPWFGLQKEFKRKYPNGKLSGQVIGFTGERWGRYDGRGITGIEASFDQYLLSKEKKYKLLTDGWKRVLTDRVLIPDSWDGYNVYLTIDASFQDEVEEFLEEGVKNAEAKRGMAIVMNPYTGEILAMANYPFFDPNQRKETTLKDSLDLCISYSFEPGSVVKPFIIAGAIDRGLLGINDIFYAEEGTYHLNGAIIHDHERYGYLSVPDIIKFSSNIGMTKIAMRLGKLTVFNILRSFGFGEKTGIELPMEASGFFRKLREWYDADLANASFGQGFRVTLIQLVTAMAVIANGGLRITPRIVKYVKNERGTTIYREEIPEVKGRVIKERTARIMKWMLERVIQKGGTGILAGIDGIKVAGKTGTAQKWVGEYTRKYYTASFVGFLPADHPMWVIGVVIDEPQKKIYGGTAAAPIFRKIAEELLVRSHYLTLK